MDSRPYISPYGAADALTTTNAPKERPGVSPEFMAARLGIKRVKSSTPAPLRSPAKRKFVDLTQDDTEEDEVAAAAANAAFAGNDGRKPKRVARKKNEEKRLRVFRSHAPVSYIQRLERVMSQRMFLIDRNRCLSEDGINEVEIFDIAGSTGNIYQVTVSLMPKCTCPDAEKGNQCKHIIYVLVNVLKVRADLAYQLAFLSTELRDIFLNAPATPQSSSEGAATASTDTGGSRKAVEGDCPVCVMEFDASDESEDVIWCEAACGNNIHRQCFEQWAKSKPGQVKCVYCRTPWKGDEDSIKRLTKAGVINEEGYVNVAGELGMSGERDTSSYHPAWVNREYYGGYTRRGRRRRYGELEYDDDEYGDEYDE